MPLVITVSEVAPNDGKVLELAKYDTLDLTNDSTDNPVASLYGGYYDQNGKNITRTASPTANHCFYKVYQIGVHVDNQWDGSAENKYYVDGNGDKWTSAQIVTYLTTHNATPAAPRKAGFQVDALESDGTTPTKAKFFSPGAGAYSTITVAEGANTKSIAPASGTSLATIKAMADTTQDVVIGYFGLYVEDTSVNDAAVSGNFRVTVTSD